MSAPKSKEDQELISSLRQQRITNVRRPLPPTWGSPGAAAAAAAAAAASIPMDDGPGLEAATNANASVATTAAAKDALTAEVTERIHELDQALLTLRQRGA